MMNRIKAKLAALRGAPAPPARHYLVVLTDANGMPQVTQWNGLMAEDAAMALCRAADSIVDRLPSRSFRIH